MGKFTMFIIIFTKAQFLCIFKTQE